MSALPPKADIADAMRNVRFVRRVQPIDATPSNLTREGGVRWRGLHGYGSRRSRGLSCGSAGRTVNVWRISLGRLRGGTRAVSIVSWLSLPLQPAGDLSDPRRAEETADGASADGPVDASSQGRHH